MYPKSQLFYSRAMTATIDKTTDHTFHDFIVGNFGMVPYTNTYPDFLAGGAVMVTALFIAAGMEVIQEFVNLICIKSHNMLHSCIALLQYKLYNTMKLVHATMTFSLFKLIGAWK